MLSNRSPVFPRGASPQARGVTRGHGPLYEEGMDLDVVDVGDGEWGGAPNMSITFSPGLGL